MAKQEDVQAMALEVAEHGMNLVRELAKTRGKGFTDGYHKYVGDLIAAMNATRSALQTTLVQQALAMRAMDIHDEDNLLKIVKPQKQLEQK